MLGRSGMLGIVIAFSVAISPFAVKAADTGAVDLANAEVIITSSSNASYVGMTNTDNQGRFVLNGVPAGGISVVIRRDGQVIAQGAGVTAGGNLSEAQVLNIVVAPLSNTLKSTPTQ